MRAERSICVRRRGYRLALLAAVALWGSAPGAPAAEGKLVRVTGRANPMGTYMIITVYAAD
jgi:hypothetical protein